MVHPKNPTPTWINPNDVGRSFLKRKSSSNVVTKKRLPVGSSKSPSKAGSASRSPFKAGFKSPAKSSPRKIVNPYKVLTPCKKRRLGTPSPRKSPRKHGLTSVEKCMNSPISSKTSRGRFLNFGSNKNLPVDFSSLSSELQSKKSESSAKKFLNFSSVTTPYREEPSSSSQRKTLTEIPMDLRPGLRMRLSSFKPFPWMKRSRVTAPTTIIIPKDDVIAGRSAVKGVDLEFDSTSCMSKLSPMARLEAIGQYFLYPDLTGFQLPPYPRLDAQSRIPIMNQKQKSVPLQRMGSNLTDVYGSKWNQTFEGLFDEWSRGERRSFYVFAHNTTIMFTKYINVNNSLTYDFNATDFPEESTIFALGQKKHRVIMTPTTSGIRKMLQDEEIEFELPLQGKNKQRDKEDKERQKENSFASLKASDLKTPEKKLIAQTTDDLLESPVVNDDGIDHDEWLKDIGISPRSTLGFRRYATVADFSMHSEMSNLGAEDESPVAPVAHTSETARSTVVISEATSIHALFNFICSSKDFRATTGPMAGLPPTLVAADSFTNCSIMCLNKTSQIVKKPGESSRLEYILEIEGGPILPHMPSMLISFVQSLPSLNVKDNKMKVTVTGRDSYLGFNEVIDRDAFMNHSIFTYNPVESTYEL